MIYLTSILAIVLFVVALVEFFIIRGSLRLQDTEMKTYKRKNLTGVEIETIRRNLILRGVEGISLHEALNLVYTIRAILLNQYEDLDPYAYGLEDPYADIEMDLNWEYRGKR